MFSNPNPFNTNGMIKPSRRPIISLDYRKISPKTILPSSAFTPAPNVQDYINRDLPDSPSWSPPESWAVDRLGEEADVPVYSSSDDGCGPNNKVGNNTSLGHKRRSRRKIAKLGNPTPEDLAFYKIRIYRSDGTYHVASVPLSTTVAELTPVLNQKVRLRTDREVHRLYLKERGRGEIAASQFSMF
jgi:adenylate cyclase